MTKSDHAGKSFVGGMAYGYWMGSVSAKIREGVGRHDVTESSLMEGKLGIFL